MRKIGLLATLIISTLCSCGNPIIQQIVGAKTISFQSNGGSRVEDQTVFKGRPVRRPADPSKPGYNFAAWYLDNNTFENEWNFATIPEAEMTLYAKWISDTKPITEIEITSPPNLSYTHGDTFNLSGLLVNVTYDDETTEVLTPDLLRPRGITIIPAYDTLLSHSTNDNTSVTMTYNSSGYNFDHDFGKLGVSQKALTITSAANTKTYDGTPSASGVSVTLDGIVAGDSVEATVTAVYTASTAGTTTIEITAIALTGAAAGNYTVPQTGIFTVVGITKAPGAAVSAPVITGNAAELSVSVTTQANLATETGQSVEYAIYDGSVLSAYGSSTMFTALQTGRAYTVYARSAENTNYLAGEPNISNPVAFYTVSFDANGGIDAPAGYTVLGGNKIEKPQPDPTRTNYTFGGWYKEAACSNEWNFASDTVSANSTLYAKWVGNTAGISISVEQIEDQSTLPADNIIISRIGNNKTYTVTVSNPDDYTSITWEIDGVGYYNGTPITGNGSTFTLDATKVEYNSLGGHTLRLIVTKGGVQYLVNINFTIVD